MPDYAFPPPSPIPPDPGLLPGPGFTGDRNPLPGGPMTWPGIPFPGTPPLPPLQEVGAAFGWPWPLQPPPGVTPRPSPGTQAGQAVYQDAYRDLPLGGPGTHSGAHPGLPASTVGGMPGDPLKGEPPGAYAREAIAQKIGLGSVPNLIPPQQAVEFGADVVGYTDLVRTMQNAVRGTANAAGPLGSVMYPTLWPQRPGGYPTMPGGGPLPYDPSLPAGGGNPSPGMPGSPSNQYPFTPPPQPYQQPLPPGRYPLPPGTAHPRVGGPYRRR